MHRYFVIAAAVAVFPTLVAAQQNQNRQSNQPATQTVAPGQQSQQTTAQRQQTPPSLNNWSYDRLYNEGWSARGLYRDTTVIGPYGDDIGSVENIILSEQGKVVGIIAEIGGFLDIGDTHLFIPWDQVKISADFERITVPVTEATADEYTFARSNLWRANTNQRTAVDSTTLRTGPTIWKLSDVLGDYTYLSDRTGYGYIHDLIVSRDGDVEAVVVSSDSAYGGGYRAFPWRGYRWGYETPYYDLGYDRNQVSGLQVLDYDQIAGSVRPLGGWNGAATGAGAGDVGQSTEPQQQRQQRPVQQQQQMPQQRDQRQ